MSEAMHVASEAAPRAVGGFARWEIRQEAPGHPAEVIVNGQDIARNVRSVTVNMGSRAEIPTLTVELIGAGTIEGSGIVTVYSDAVAYDCDELRNLHPCPPGEPRCVCGKYVPPMISDRGQILGGARP